MQKKLIALAVAGLASGAAFAQSNVTVYGVADAFYARASIDNFKTDNVIGSGGLSGSRIGFKGVEDIGNGLKALFVLEYALAIDANSGVGADFTLAGASNNAARQQLLGLTGAFGTVVAGYAQTAGYDFACATSGYAGSALDAYNYVGSRFLLQCGKSGRAGNAFAYISPSFGGVTGAFNHARVTEDVIASSASTSNSYANMLAVNYAGGPVAVGAVYSKATLNHTAADDDIVEYGVNGSFDFGVGKVYASYQTLDNKNLADKDKKYGISGTFPIGTSGFAVHAGYAKSKLKQTAANDDLKSWTVAGTYGLSKRSTVYAGYVRLTNSDAGTATVVSPVAVTAGGKSSILAVGLRHTF